MKLIIDNFAKIEHADILVDGITVIAGENNTGKSTVGKVLFSLFNSIAGIEGQIVNQRLKEIEDICYILVKNNYIEKIENNSVEKEISMVAKHIAFTITNELDLKTFLGDNSYNKNDITFTIKKVLKYSNIKYSEIDEFNQMIDETADKIISIFNLPNQAIISEVLTRYFNSVFYKQINSLNNENKNAILELEIKKKCINLVFSNNECTEFSADIPILNKAVYIDNPFIIDTLSSTGELNTIDDYLKNLLIKNNKADIMDGIFESVLAKEKLKEVYQTLQTVVDGQIIKNQHGFALQNDGFSEPVNFNNLSAGLKSFVIIKMLLEKGVLKEKDVLVLDEPEIHLHPQWQVAYAELIVLLQKSFDLSIIIATHSPYFLDAINLFSVKHGIDKKVNYYLSSMENNKVNMEIVTDNIDLIYKKMVSPVQLLDTLRHQLNNE